MSATPIQMESFPLLGSFNDPSEPASGGGAAAASLLGKIAGGVVGAILGSIPLIKHWSDDASKSAEHASNAAAAKVYKNHEAANARGMHGMDAVETIRLRMAADVASHTHTALYLLKHNYLPARINEGIRPVHKLAAQAHTLAERGIGDAAIAEKLAKSAERTAKAAVGAAADAFGKSKRYTDAEIRRHGGVSTREAGKIARREAGKTVRTRDKAQGESAWKEFGMAGAAAVTGVAALTAVLEDAGLGRRQCRKNTRDICGTDPALWEGLLAGLVGAGAIFSLDELADAARGLMDATEFAVREIKAHS